MAKTKQGAAEFESTYYDTEEWLLADLQDEAEPEDEDEDDDLDALDDRDDLR